MKKICLVTNWYPTKDNPIQGCFFKEQAFAVSDNFYFVIFRFQERIKKSFFNRDYVRLINEEKNTIEYEAIAYVSIFYFIYDLIYSFVIKRSDKKLDGIGKYVSQRHQKIIYRKINSLYEKTGESSDVFYCVDGQTEAFYLECLSKCLKKPYVVGEHAPVPWPGTLISDVNKYAIENANLFLAISNDKIRQLLLQDIKLPEIRYIGNMIDDSFLKIPVKRKSSIKTFIIVASHSYYKNYDMFIKVMNRLCDITTKEFKVLIVGYAANKGYSKNVKEFEEKIHKSEFANKVELIPQVPRMHIGEVLGRADAFVMTSIQEGQPVSAMEAACCGLPIFSTRCGGVEDYVDDALGRIYDVNDVEGMAAGLKAFLEDEIIFDSITIRERVVAMFGKDVFCHVFTNSFISVLSNKT